MDNKVIVTDGNTLTIEAGTVIKAANNPQPNTVALIVARGADIYALGSATHPIIMTSYDDDVKVDGTYTSGPNLTASDNGLWGGLVVLGKAYISPDSNAQVAIAEGIEASNAWAEFGGTDDADNEWIKMTPDSGLKLIMIESFFPVPSEVYKIKHRSFPFQKQILFTLDLPIVSRFLW